MSMTEAEVLKFKLELRKRRAQFQQAEVPDEWEVPEQPKQIEQQAQPQRQPMPLPEGFRLPATTTDPPPLLSTAIQQWMSPESRQLAGQVIGGLMPGMQAPAVLAKVPLLGKAVQGALSAAPPIAGATALGTAQHVDPNKSLSENLVMMEEKAKGIAGEEVIGFGVGKGIEKTLRRMFPGISKANEKLMKYAKEKNVRIDPEALIKSPAKTLSKVSKRGMLGHFARKIRSDDIMSFIEAEAERLAPTIKSVEETAQSVANNLGNTLSNLAESSKRIYDDDIKAMLPEGTVVSWDNTKSAVLEKANDLLKRNHGESKLYKYLDSKTQRPTNTLRYNDLDHIERKLKKLGKDSEYKEDVDWLLREMAKDWQAIGVKHNIELPKLRTKAATKYKELNDISKLIKPSANKDFSVITRNEQGYIKSIFNQQNRDLLDYVARAHPDVFKDIKNARLEFVFREMMEGDKFNPKPLKTFMRQNQKFLKEMYGDETFDALQGFQVYTEDVGKMLQASVQDSIPGTVVEGALYATKVASLPTILAADATAGALASALTNPKNPFFKLFTAETPAVVNKLLGEAAKLGVRQSGLNQLIERNLPQDPNRLFQLGAPPQ